MKPIIMLMLCALLVFPGAASATGAVPAMPTPQQAQTTYLVLYRPGPAWAAGKPIRQQPPKEHGRYMLELFKQGKLRSAGPFEDDSGAAVVLLAVDAAEAEALVAADPAVAEGVFRYQIHPWSPVPWQQYVRD
ncbi:YciI family protein [Pseudoxanthomonas wuyuanensis]|uniref:Uncharacterized conserved protein YciI, contains a putative active-site phosphohistidine n=1 Tax=Pseudoxanthomonas wuyuanensis TaxID=1073196 RepID=A0A286DF16_9GAMM|nr:YciI family protein [Pseudoxanthomonas wuyuanensis]KAF1719913.1 hypothetical protein CSC75_13405 [Pseudoxanthomonas wuyuanensis]SOD57180.1 Uncharacterized conserved protein YciI, contains a putative active-site phosphohistidine [Pseudoxanthomonas wuyuanensis]